MKIHGQFTYFGDNIDTDQIIAGQYLRTDDPSVWSKHIFETLDPIVAEEVRQRSIIVAGHNFGCGSSREQAVLALKSCGVQAIVACSFAMIFYRNCINNGILPVTVRNLVLEKSASVDTLFIDTDQSHIQVGSQIWEAEPISKFVLDLVQNGDLMSYFIQEGKLRVS